MMIFAPAGHDGLVYLTGKSPSGAFVAKAEDNKPRYPARSIALEELGVRLTENPAVPFLR
jgi:hypothetical protein